jgi:hypothetical protein
MKTQPNQQEISNDKPRPFLFCKTGRGMTDSARLRFSCVSFFGCAHGNSAIQAKTPCVFPAILQGHAWCFSFIAGSSGGPNAPD